MTDPIARDLIQRLADALAEWQLGGAPPEDTTDADLINEARAYLLQPVDLSHLSDDEHNALCPQGYHATGNAAPTVAETPTSCIYLNTTSTEEVMRLDSQGLHYQGQFIADAGEAHQLLVAWLRRNSDEPAVPSGREPTDEDLQSMLYYEFSTSTGHGTREDPIGFARAVLARWGSC